MPSVPSACSMSSVPQCFLPGAGPGLRRFVEEIGDGVPA